MTPTFEIAERLPKRMPYRMFVKPLTPAMPPAADVPVPPGLAGLLGYPCVPPERFVCLTWDWVLPERRPVLIWQDGLAGGRADEAAWDAYVGHPSVAPGLAGADFGHVGWADDCLLVDTVAGRAFVVSYARGHHLARLASPAFHLPLADSAAYDRAADQVLRPLWEASASSPNGDDQQVAALVRWLDGQPKHV